MSSVELSGCEFDESGPNTFDQKQGGGICLRSGAEASIKGCTIKGTVNITANEGGGIYAVDSNLTIEDTKIQNNKAQKKGGGLFIQAAYADVNLTINGNTKFISNNADTSSNDTLGGGIYMKGRSGKSVTAVMTGGEIKINQAQEGGGIYIDRNASFTMKGGSLSGNAVPTGSGGKGCAVYINNNGAFIWEGGTITGHTANHVIEGNGTFTNNSSNTAS